MAILIVTGPFTAMMVQASEKRNQIVGLKVTELCRRLLGQQPKA
jgi:hypothetical protein